MSGTSIPRDEQPIIWGKSLTFWTRLTLVWLMAITVTGAAVRLTGSGLGCTDWPTCTVNTELDAPGFHSAVEFGNRMISGLAIIPVIAAFIGARRDARSRLVPWLIAMVIGFLGQVVLGMLVTRTELDPRMVLGHFLLSIVLIFIAVVLDFFARVKVAPAEMSSSTDLVNKARRVRARFLLASASMVIIVGTLVTGSGPHTGSEPTGEPISRLAFDIREISRAHSLLGWLLVALIVLGLIQSRPQPETTLTPEELTSLDRTWYLRIGALALLQGGIGYLQYSMGVPVLLVAFHIVGSVLLWTAIAWYAMVTAYPVDTGADRTREPEFSS